MSTSYTSRPLQTATYKNYYPNQTAQAQSKTPLVDDVEPWYDEPGPNNRMLLALRSGVLSEVSWALARLLRFSLSDRFVLSVWPGLVDALCDWPDWFVAHAEDEGEDGSIFSPSPDYSLKRRFALTSLLVLKNSAHLDENSATLSGSRRVRFLVFMTLNRFRIQSDSKHEFLLGVLEIFRLAVYKHNPPPGLDRMSPLISIVANSQDKATIISGLYGLQNILDAFPNVRHVTPTSGSLKTAIYLLGIMEDRELVLASLEYLLAHLANPTLAKAFLHHPDLPGVLRLLVLQILYDQKLIAENVFLPVHSSANDPSLFSTFELPKEEMESLALVLEPGRASEWMRRMFVPDPDHEMTQVEFWTFYKFSWEPYKDKQPLLMATEVIKLVTSVFPLASATMADPEAGRPQRFVLRGIRRRESAEEGVGFKCQWNNWGCAEAPFETPQDLFVHVLEHIQDLGDDICSWGACKYDAPTGGLRAHVATHMPLARRPKRPPGQKDLPLGASRITDPIIRSPPAARPFDILWRKPREDPPSTSFAAVLVLRVLFRTAFTGGEVVLKADEDHFGFPGVEQGGDGDDPRGEVAVEDLGYDEFEGLGKGKRAFSGILTLLNDVVGSDYSMAGWVEEIIDAIKSESDGSSQALEGALEI